MLGSFDSTRSAIGSLATALFGFCISMNTPSISAWSDTM